METLTNVLSCNDGATIQVKQDASEVVRQAVARAKQVFIWLEGSEIRMQ